MKKKILVDLSILKNPHCGLGQIALNYGKYYKENIDGTEDFVLHLLVPKKYINAFGNKVEYIESKRIYRKLPFLLPKFDVWHAIHQLSRFMPFNRSTKYILTIHDFNFVYEKKGGKINKYLNKIQSKINRADKIFCISEFAKLETQKYAKLNDKNIEVNYNGVEALNPEIGIKPSCIKSENEKFFFTIGEIKEKKNFHTLLDLMKLMPDKKLYIAGKDSTKYADLIKERIEKENIKNVVLSGIISNEERIWLYAHCEAFLFPSLFEGFGLPIIEALSFGKAVFSSQETSLKEIGGNHVFFWNDFEAENMKKIITDNLESYYLDKDKIQSNIKYAEGFCYKRHIKQYIANYENI